MPSTSSIRSRLLLWIALPFTALAFMALLSSYLLLNKQINAAFDAMLLNAAQRLERRVYTAEGQLRINMHYFNVSTLGSRGEGKIFYRIRGEGGGMMAGFQGLGDPPAATDVPVFYDVDYAGNELRAVALTFPFYRGSDVENIEVIVAESKETRRSLTHEFMATLAGLTTVTGILAITLALLAIHRGLAPLNAISRALRLRSTNDLQPINDTVPREIHPLIQSINYLMQRMRRSITSTQQLNADVSHQLRTPISEIRALTEMTLKTDQTPATRANLLEIQRIAEHAGNTVQQLLKYAKTRSELFEMAQLHPVDLVAISQQACQQAATSIYQKGQELAFEQPEHLLPVLGDPILLQWLVDNLIDNASVHAGGQSTYRGTITLTLNQDPQHVRLSVHDDGVGVDQAFLPHLTERFFRHNPHSSGSGLGLAIAEQVAAIHDAHLTLKNRPQGGLEVTVTFPTMSARPADHQRCHEDKQ